MAHYKDLDFDVGVIGAGVCYRTRVPGLAKRRVDLEQD